MPKVNAWALPRPPRRQETRTFVDPEAPDYPVTLTLEEPDIIRQAAARERATELIELYVDAPEGEEANLFPVPSGPTVGRLNRTICAALAMLETLQAGPEEERYSAEELLGIALNLRGAWAEISPWARSFIPEEEDRGNSARASGPSSPASPSSASGSDIPTSTSTNSAASVN